MDTLGLSTHAGCRNATSRPTNRSSQAGDSDRSSISAIISDHPVTTPVDRHLGARGRPEVIGAQRRDRPAHLGRRDLGR